MSQSAAEAAREWLKSNGVLGTGVPWSTLLAELTALLESREAAARAEAWESAKRAAADYCENVLAANHPHLAEAYRHAAHNIRAAVSPPREGEPDGH